MAGFEDAIDQIVSLDKCHRLLDELPADAKVLFLIDTGDNYRVAKYGVLSRQDALWMMKAFEHSVLFPRIIPPEVS